MSKNEKTSGRVGRIAAKVMNNAKLHLAVGVGVGYGDEAIRKLILTRDLTSADLLYLAASALTQRPDKVKRRRS